MFYLHHKGIENQETRCSGFVCRPQVDVSFGFTLQSRFVVATPPLPLACHIPHEVAGLPPESFALSSTVALSRIPFWLLPLGLYVNSIYMGQSPKIQGGARMETLPDVPASISFPPAMVLLIPRQTVLRQMSSHPPSSVPLFLPSFNGCTSYPTSFYLFLPRI